MTGDGRVFSTNPAHDFGGVPATTRLRAPDGRHGRALDPPERGRRRAAAAGVGWAPTGYWQLGADGSRHPFG